jgi:flagellar protein FliS
MMTLTETHKSYRISAIQGASPIGLIIVLFDALAGDLRRAAAALRRNDIEERCRQLNHAVLVLGQLDDWVDRASGGEASEKLIAFYAYLRKQMMQAAVTRSAETLEASIATIMDVRAAWQQLDARTLEPLPEPTDPMNAFSAPSHDVEKERIPFSFTG